MLKIAILASGSGSNAAKILEYFKHHSTINIVLIGTNKANAGVLEYAEKFNIKSFVFTAQELQNGYVLKQFKELQINTIILAGFLALVPSEIIAAFPSKILNIHPSLLPKFGGKGMYGLHVHKAVLANKEKKSGLTIHLVNEDFDKGKILFQCTCSIDLCQLAEEIQRRVLICEHRHYATVIEAYLLSREC